MQERWGNINCHLCHLCSDILSELDHSLYHFIVSGHVHVMKMVSDYGGPSEDGGDDGGGSRR